MLKEHVNLNDSRNLLNTFSIPESYERVPDKILDVMVEYTESVLLHEVRDKNLRQIVEDSRDLIPLPIKEALVGYIDSLDLTDPQKSVLLYSYLDKLQSKARMAVTLLHLGSAAVSKLKL